MLGAQLASRTGSFLYGLERRLGVGWKVEALPRLFPVQETDVVFVSVASSVGNSGQLSRQK